jgi:type I restriction enzyme, S subunit
LLGKRTMRELGSSGGWTRVAFGDVVRLRRERSSDPEGDGFDRYIGLDHIEPGELGLRRWGDLSEGSTFTNVFRAGDVLFGKRRAYQRKVAVADFDGVCSGDIYVLEVKNEHLMTELLPFICQTDGFFEHAVGTSAGSLSPRTNWNSLASYEFALPPLDDQRQIAAVLKTHDLVIDALVRARDEGICVRESLLASLFSVAGLGHDSVALEKLLLDGSLVFQTGPFGTVLAAREYRKDGWPIVNPTHIRDNQIVHEGGPCVDDDAANRLGKYRMSEGDILLARKGEIDKACWVGADQNGWIVGSDCILLRSDPAVIAGRYLLLFLQSPASGRTLRSLAHGTVMPGLNEKMLARLVIPMRDLPLQRQDAAIVGELDSVLSRFADRLAAARAVRASFMSKTLHV